MVRLGVSVLLSLSVLDAALVKGLQLVLDGAAAKVGLLTFGLEESFAFVFGERCKVCVLDFARIDVAGRRDVPAEKACSLQVVLVGGGLFAPLWVDATASLVILELVIKETMNMVKLTRLGTLSRRED